MKANFKFDPDFPVIDGVGHSDKIDFFNVKGGGSTNTTCLDPDSPGFHVFPSWRSYTSVSSGTAPRSFSGCEMDPTLSADVGVAVPGCLNAIQVGDNHDQRASDRVVLHRLVVNGSLRRAPNESDLEFGSLPCLPKVFVAVVLDKAPNGAAFNCDLCFDDACAPGVGAAYSGVPWLDQKWVSRFSVLAFDVKDFGDCLDAPYTWIDTPESWSNVPPAPSVVVPSRYAFWRDVVVGFRFDIDLNTVLCSFSSSSGTYTSLVDCGLHVVAVLFDGINTMGYSTTAGDFNHVDIQYQSYLLFEDFLSPKAASMAPGADGDVVPDDEVPLAILADQSGRMAGDGSFLDRPVKRSKAAHGFYNFAPRSGDAMLFEDDPEFARLQAPGANRGPTRKSDSRARVYPIAARRWKAHKYDDNEDYYAREGDRGGKRGKY